MSPELPHDGDDPVQLGAPFQFVHGPEVFLLLAGERRGEAADPLLMQDQVAQMPLR
jgi:hypothetical protein